jgi:hypothetical protein
MARILIIGILLILLPACAGPFTIVGAERGSGTPVSRSFDLEGFSRIDANSAAQVEVTRGDAFHVEVEVDDNLAPRLDVAVRGDTLYIRLQNGSYDNFTLRGRVTMPRLTGVTLNGASTLRGDLAGEDLALDLNGGGRATLSGVAGRVTIKINGGALAQLGDLTAQDVQLDANGGGQVEIAASGAVRGRANGGAIITLTGSPTSVDVQTDGGAQVTVK